MKFNSSKDTLPRLFEIGVKNVTLWRLFEVGVKNVTLPRLFEVGAAWKF